MGVDARSNATPLSIDDRGEVIIIDGERTMIKLSVAVLAFLGFALGSAFADSIDDIQMNGVIGGVGGYHTIVVDGVSCKLRNSSVGGGQGAGCHYKLTGGISGMGQGALKATTGNAGCSTSCQ